MSLKSLFAGPLGVGSVVAAGHIGALAVLARLDGAAVPPAPVAIQVELSTPEPPASDPGPVPDEGPSPLPEATPLPVAPTTENVEAPDPVVALADETPSPAAPSQVIPLQGDPGPAPSTPTIAASSELGDGTAGDGQGEGELAESSDYLTNPAPSYPLASRLLGEEGRVLVRVLVDTSGKARSVALHKGCGHSRLEGSALAAVWSWKFHPAKRGGKPVEAWVIVPLRFSLKGA